jgi:hypothetical protein
VHPCSGESRSCRCRKSHTRGLTSRTRHGLQKCRTPPGGDQGCQSRPDSFTVSAIECTRSPRRHTLVDSVSARGPGSHFWAWKLRRQAPGATPLRAETRNRSFGGETTSRPRPDFRLQEKSWSTIRMGFSAPTGCRPCRAAPFERDAEGFARPRTDASGYRLT